MSVNNDKHRKTVSLMLPDGEVVWHGVAVIMKYKYSFDYCPAKWEKYWTKYGE